MDWLLDVFATWLYGLKVIAITLAVIMFISGLDDFFIDVVYWVRRIKRKLSVYRRYPRMSYRELYKPDEKPLAIMVPAWNETGVIGNMAELAATTLDYENYHIFVGTYPNDPDTQRDVDEVCARFPNVHKVVCARPGPTSKADCLNNVLDAITQFERSANFAFAGFILHDAEDVISPMELRLFNYLVERKDLIQIPVYPFEREWTHFTSMTYIDEFSELHGKDFDSSIGLRSGAMSTANNNVGGAAPGKSYRSYGQLEAEYRIGRNMLLEGDLLSVYSRVFADTGENGVMMPVKNPMSGTGLRWKPLRDQIFFLAVEQQLPLNGQNGASDTMLRASASFFNGGKYSDEWHPNGSGWFAQNLYLDAAQYIRQDIQAWTADYRVSWHQKVANGQTIEPYAQVQDNGYRDKGTQGAQLGGVGVRWNIWTGETHYDAWPHKVSLGVEYQHTFKAINQRNGERNNAFLTIGVHW